MKKMNKRALKTFGFLALVGGALCSVLSSIVEDRKMEETISEKVQESIARLTAGNEEEES